MSNLNDEYTPQDLVLTEKEKGLILLKVKNHLLPPLSLDTIYDFLITVDAVIEYLRLKNSK